MAIYLYAPTCGQNVKKLFFPYMSNAMPFSHNLILGSLNDHDHSFELVIGILVSEALTFLSAAVLTLTAESFIKILS